MTDFLSRSRRYQYPVYTRYISVDTSDNSGNGTKIHTWIWGSLLSQPAGHINFSWYLKSTSGRRKREHTETPQKSYFEPRETKILLLAIFKF